MSEDTDRDGGSGLDIEVGAQEAGMPERQVLAHRRLVAVDSLERLRKAVLQQNCMVRKLQILPHNIGYLKLDFFPNTSLCGPTVRTVPGNGLADKPVYVLTSATTWSGAE